MSRRSCHAHEEMRHDNRQRQHYDRSRDTEVLTAALMRSKDGARSNSRKPRRSKRIKRANKLLVKEPEPLAPNPVAATLEQARCTLINLIKAHAREDRYAALLSRARTTEAKTLVRSVVGSFVYFQRNTGKRVRKYGEKTGKTYHEAIERFIGDLLRAKGDTRSSGRIFHATGATTFDDVPVNYNVFMRMLAGLAAHAHQAATQLLWSRGAR